MPKLNPSALKRQAFAEFVAQGLSATEAYRKAGYKAKGHSAEELASRLLRNVDVQQIISTAAEKASKGRILTAQQRREILTQIALGEIEQEITTDTRLPDGKTTSSTQRRKPTSAERKGAIEHLDKLDGLILDRHEHSGKNGQPLSVLTANIPDDVIRARLAELNAKKPTPTKGTK